MLDSYIATIIWESDINYFSTAYQTRMDQVKWKFDCSGNKGIFWQLFMYKLIMLQTGNKHLLISSLQ